MTDQFMVMCYTLQDKIKEAYTSGVTLEEAERLAGEFLHAQMEVAKELQVVDLDSRMRKSGVKAIKAAVYMEAATKTDKKPSDVMLEAVVNMSKMVADEQAGFDAVEVSKDALSNYLNIFKEAHVHFRGISRGRYE